MLIFDVVTAESRYPAGNFVLFSSWSVVVIHLTGSVCYERVRSTSV